MPVQASGHKTDHSHPQYGDDFKSLLIIRILIIRVVFFVSLLKQEALVFTRASPKGARKMIRNLS